MAPSPVSVTDTLKSGITALTAWGEFFEAVIRPRVVGKNWDKKNAY
jgi:hypothetical protein